MSVRTAADEKRDRAMELVDAAAEIVASLVYRHESGVEEYTEEYRKRLLDAANMLVKVHNTLNPLWINP